MNHLSTDDTGSSNHGEIRRQLDWIRAQKFQFSCLGLGCIAWIAIAIAGVALYLLFR